LNCINLHFCNKKGAKRNEYCGEILSLFHEPQLLKSRPPIQLLVAATAALCCVMLCCCRQYLSGPMEARH